MSTSGAWSAPDRLILKLALGEAPSKIASLADVRSGASEPVAETGHGPVDRVLRQMAGGARIARLHSAAASLGQDGRAHHNFSDLEQVLGLSRTFAVELAETCRVEDLVGALRQLSMVEEASPHYLSTLPFALADAPPRESWHTRDLINAPQALAREPGDRTVIVAICDTGVDHAHPEFHERLRSGLSTVELQPAQLAAGVTLVAGEAEDDSNPEDHVGHGTGCAGIIGAQGERIPRGLAGECSVLPIQVLGAARFVGGRDAVVGVGAIPDIDIGVKNAVDLGAKVLNMSFGTPASALAPFDPPPHADVVAYALAHGCILVAASGNSGREEDFLPASYSGVIAVGAVGRGGAPTAFSTRGEHVALAAPGERVVTCGLEGYQLATGTSFAAPFVAAAAALLVSHAARHATALDAAAVRRILCQSARPWPAGTESGHGVGVLDVEAALRHLDDEISVASEHRHAARRAAHSAVAAGGTGL